MNIASNTRYRMNEINGSRLTRDSDDALGEELDVRFNLCFKTNDKIESKNSGLPRKTYSINVMVLSQCGNIISMHKKEKVSKRGYDGRLTIFCCWSPSVW